MTTPPDPRTAEAKRQRQLMDSLLAPHADAGALATRESEARALRGLQAYRANAHAVAARALAAAFPTVAAMVGDEDFSHLARDLWHQSPPVRGDLGVWGGELPAWLEANEALAEWPYLGDCARLDWAVHQCERAEDAQLDAASVARLGDTDPSRLRLQLMPGLAVLASRWPIVLILDAHRGGGDAALAQVREALAADVGENAVVFRQGWRGAVARVDAQTVRWMQLLLAGSALDDAMSRMDASFDFAAWLANALQSGWLKGIAVAAD